MEGNDMDIDQGTIIKGVRSLKYPDVCCYAILVSASCDISNRKIDKIYYLTALKLKDWMTSSVGINCILGNIMKNKKNVLVERLNNNGLDCESFLEFSKEDAYRVIESEVSHSEISKIKKCYDDYIDNCININTVSGKLSLYKKYKNEFISFMKRLEKGDLLHYYYLPKVYYIEERNTYDGLIVDLQEIDYITLDDMDMIKQKGIDYLSLDENDEKKMTSLKECFYLLSDCDYVECVGKVTSPRREHLLQRFSGSFVRIGIDMMDEIDCELLLDEVSHSR